MSRLSRTVVAIDRTDDVVALHAALGRGSTRPDPRHQDSLGIRQTVVLTRRLVDTGVVHADSDPPATHFPELAKLVDHVARLVDRQRETDAFREVLPPDRGVDADHVAGSESSSGPPELPRLIAASVWMKLTTPLSVVGNGTRRPFPDTTPTVTV